MNCPVCNKPMLVLEVDQIEVDHCVACGGTWLDAGELELLLDGAANRDVLLGEMKRAETSEAARVCPICEKQMEKSRVDDVIVDTCGGGDGIWFDQGELRAVIAMGRFPGDNRVYELLNNVFGGR